MPFRSKAQYRALAAKAPSVFRKWRAEGYTQDGLPEHVAKKKSKISQALKAEYKRRKDVYSQRKS